MSFDLLPADQLLKIFHQLPLKDRVRISGVNRLFRDISVESIAKMKSLVINDDLTAYLNSGRKFSTLLESCSRTLEFIDASDRSCNKWLLSALTEFVYPKLKHLKIMVRHEEFDTSPINVPDQVKKLVSHCPNLRSCILHLNWQFEWPGDVVFEKMEKLQIYVPFDLDERRIFDLSPTLRPLIGNVPNLKHLTICVLRSYDHTIGSVFTESRLSAQEFTQLLDSTSSLEELYLDLPRSSSVNIFPDFKDVIPTWCLPKLTTLHIGLDLECPNQASILRYFPASFPLLVSFKSDMIKVIDDQGLLVLSQLMHLCELYLTRVDMTAAQIIDLVTSIPSIFTLGIADISEVDSLEKFIDFLKSTAVIFRRDLEIKVILIVEGSEAELEDILEGMEDSGGPKVSYNRIDEGDVTLYVNSIRYMALD